ncbi:MAG: hypothetical protein ACP5T7_05590 [bacterium]
MRQDYLKFLLFACFPILIIISSCSTGPSSNPYANVCNSFLSGTRLVSISPDTGTQFGDQQVTATIKGLLVKSLSSYRFQKFIILPALHERL